MARLLICLLMVVGGPVWAAEPTGREAAAGTLVELTTAYSTHLTAYVAGPPDAAQGALLVHDRWGLNDRVVAWADRFAALGYRVVAADLYDGRSVHPDSMGQTVWSQIDPVWMQADLDAALAYLSNGRRQVVAVAWGLGIRPGAELVQRSSAAFTALIAYYDGVSSLRVGRLPELPVPVLDVSTPVSLVYPRPDTATEQAGEDAWQATRNFLSGLGTGGE